MANGPSVDLKRTAGLPEPGLYRFRVEEIELKDGPSGHPYFNCTVVIDDGEWEDKQTWLILSLSPKARWKMEEALDAMGAPEEGKVDMAWFRGRKFYAMTHNEEFEGVERMRIEKMIPREDVQTALKAQREAAARMQVEGQAAKASALEADPNLEPAETESTLSEEDEEELEEIIDDLWD